jgi:hypothetical protein
MLTRPKHSLDRPLTPRASSLLDVMGGITADLREKMTGDAGMLGTWRVTSFLFPVTTWGLKSSSLCTT